MLMKCIEKCSHQKNSMGFSALEIVLAVSVVALVGTVGFMFWQNFMTNDEARDNTQTQSRNSGTETKYEQVKPDDSKLTEANTGNGTQTTREAESWTRFDSKGFSFTIPDGWNLTLNTKSGILYYGTSGDSLTYTKGKSAVIDKASQVGASVAPGFIVKTQLVSPATFDGSRSFTSRYGIEVKKVSKQVDSFGTTRQQYYYQFAVPGISNPMQVSYAVSKNQTDYSKQLEMGLKELRLE